LHPDGVHAFLDVPGLVDHQHRAGITQPFGDIAAQVVADRGVVPDRLAQQVLHPVRVVVTGMFGDGPAVLTGQPRQQPQHEPPDPAPRFDPGEPRRDLVHQRVEHRLPLVTV
jgi:hypothetical protein